MTYGKVPLGFIESQFIYFVFDREQMNQTIAQTIVNALGIVYTPRPKILVDEADICLPDHSDLPVFAPPESGKIVDAAGHEDKTNQHVIHLERKPLDGIQDKQIEVRLKILKPNTLPIRDVQIFRSSFHDPLFIALQSGSFSFFPYRLPFSAAFSGRIQSRNLESTGSRRRRNAV